MTPFGNGGGPGPQFVRIGRPGPGWWAVPRLVLALALLVLVVLACIAVLRYLSEGRSRRNLPHSGANAESILEERFARGEIGAEELRSSLQNLRSLRNSQPN